MDGLVCYIVYKGFSGTLEWLMELRTDCKVLKFERVDERETCRREFNTRITSVDTIHSPEDSDGRSERSMNGEKENRQEILMWSVDLHYFKAVPHPIPKSSTSC